MSLRLRLSLLPLLLAGCASELLVVPDSDWQTVPAPQRDAVDRQLAADLAAARSEITAASTGLAEVKRSPPPPVAAAPAPRSPAAPKPGENGDESATKLQAQEQASLGAKAQVEAAKAAWQRADVTWRQLRLDAANARLAMIVYERELVRAQTVDHNLPGTDHYNVAPLRGQFSRAQQRWHSIASNAKQARTALEQASATLASAKESYAQLMRNGPRPPSTQPAIASEDRAPQLQLTRRAITRSDIRRRRGLRHFLDAGTTPQLRGVAIQLSARRGATTIPAAEPSINGKPSAGAPQGNAPDAVTKPAERPASPPSPAPATSISGKPPAGAPQGNATTAAKPVERPASPSSPAPATSINAKPPAGAPLGSAPAAAVKPAERPVSQADTPKR